MSHYPAKLDHELDEILGLMPWQTGPIAHALRADGEYIPKKCEREQANVMHWMIGLYLEHGSAWRDKVTERLTAIAEAAKEAATETTT